MYKKGRILSILFFFAAALSFAQQGRGSIPGELLRPSRTEAPHYPVDIVIGDLGQGRATAAAYTFARTVSSALVTGRMDHPELAAINPLLRENHLDALAIIQAKSFRIGSGREEPDGAFSFLVRFMGREEAITGELYVRQRRPAAENGDGNTPVWVFDELILEQARRRGTEGRSINRTGFFSYERFF